MGEVGWVRWGDVGSGGVVQGGGDVEWGYCWVGLLLGLVVKRGVIVVWGSMGQGGMGQVG